MILKDFILNYKKAFGEKVELPLAFWYSDYAIAQTDKKGHCIFSRLNVVRNGYGMSLNAGNIGCGGGKFYCGFAEIPPYVPDFVSLKEHYKQSPGLVEDMLAKIDVPRTAKSYLNFARIDKLESFGDAEGLLFYATPDMLRGLVTWAAFDNNEEDAVMSVFGSGCANAITYAIRENSKGGYRCFLGLFDPSARPHVASNIMTFVIPMSRFKVMSGTLLQSCLSGTHAWNKIRERIEREAE